MKILYYILIIFISFSNISCSKKKINSSQSLEAKNRIIDSLNAQDHESVLSLVNKELATNPNDSELLFYKACALAIKGGIDLFVLYPVLKMKFFHEAIVDWDDLKKYENPYQKFFKMDFDHLQININRNIKTKIRKAISKFEHKVKNLSLEDIEDYFSVYDKINETFLKGKYSLDTVQRDYLQLLATNYKQNRQLLIKLNNRFNEKIKVAKVDYEKYKKKYEDRAQEEIQNVINEVNEVNGLRIVDNEIRPSIGERNESIINPSTATSTQESSESKESIDDLLDQIIDLQAKSYKTTVAINKVIETQETVENQPIDTDSNVNLDLKLIKDNAMKIIWGVYMALPIISLLPEVKDENLKFIDEALEILNRVVHKKDHLLKKTQHYMSFLSAVSFLIVFKKTLTVDNVIDPLSFVCHFDYNIMFTSYFRLHNYLNYFLKGAVGINLSNKFFTKIADFSNKIEDDKGDLTNDAKNVIKESLRKVKGEICDMDSK